MCCSVTAAGAALARRLPYEHRAGRVLEAVREVWPAVDGLVIVGAAGIAVRAIAPLLGGKGSDPGVVCVDDAGRFAIALAGGHAGGANRLAAEVAALLGAEPVVTTASDLPRAGPGVAALDDLPGLRASGDVAGVTRRWLDGTPPVVRRDPPLASWPLPPALEHLVDGDATAEAGMVTVTDAAREARQGEVLLRPASMVLGVGSVRGADPVRLRDLALEVLAEAGIDSTAVGLVATLDRKASEPAITALAAGLAARVATFAAAELAAVEVPTPSQVVAAAVGTPSVAEAAALAAAGRGATVVVPKRASTEATVAVARRAHPAGHLAVVGLGPGSPSLRTPAAAAAVRHAGTVIGYGPYVDMAADLLGPGQVVVRSPIGDEVDRCTDALRRAADGETVALVCSGDPGVYAMASLVCELAPAGGDPPITVVPGVTAALSAAALLGAPLGHDHAAISLSDLLTPWEVIARRLEAAGTGDFVVSLYNPRSQRRSTQLERALSILGAHRQAGTPAAVVTDAGRPGQQVTRATLATLDPREVGMLSVVVVGATTTRWVGSWMVTPRGYCP